MYLICINVLSGYNILFLVNVCIYCINVLLDYTLILNLYCVAQWMCGLLL